MVLFQGSSSSTLLVEKTREHFLICFRTEFTKLAQTMFKLIMGTHILQLEADLGATSPCTDGAQGQRQ